MSFDRGVPPPDWARAMVHPPAQRQPVGDPTLWGNSVMTLIDDDPALGNTSRIIEGEQILLAQAADGYARSWSLSGALAVKGSGWIFLPGTPPAGQDTPANGMDVFLSVILGLGKTSIEHRLNLACNGVNTNIGLCWNQCALNGGPYVPTYQPLPINDDSYITLPFAAIGALVANTISIRALYYRGGGPTVIHRAIMTCLLTPYAAGTGL